ncbi:hypothetical protein CIG75_04525 [Tumebacillus algifaecis]|uniref:N-acetyltransferase domain-containing protein n=1 Tax=Tumebacillus algifaecis TaxID=1214604 RepID=A0A223CYC3_9BACL|nr:GNAT family N-acetyltransferase [Tumebacillus algifaecis]ASS74321.1 hypothetical protein CIG75_04525 [Tumebacillus algifaecis]
MSQLEFLHSYSDQSAQRASLIGLFQSAFGIPPEFFADLLEKGFWNPSYRPLSFFAEGNAVANISLFDFPIRLEGKTVRAAGIQSVMTHPDHRGQGLIRRLFDELFQRCEAQYELFFLYARDHEMYEKFGFRLVPQSHFCCDNITRAPDSFTPLRALNVHNAEDSRLLKNLFATRRPVSDVLGPINHSSSFFFALLADAEIEIAYLPDQAAAIAYSLQDGVLHLYDIVSQQIPSLAVILSCLPTAVERVEVYFTPDQLQTEYTALELTTDAKLMVRGSFPERLIFQPPPTAEF